MAIHWLVLLLLLLWAVLVALPVASADSDGPASDVPVVDVGGADVDAHGFATVVVTDRSRALTIDQVAAGEGDMKITDGQIVSGLADFFGETDYWIGFRLWNDSGDPVTRIISMDDWFHPDIDFYEQTASGWRETRRGSAYAEQLGADAFIPNVRAQLQPGEARTYWIAIPWRAGGWSSSAHVQDLQTFDRAKWRLVFVTSAFFGAFAALILYNLFLLAIQRKRIYFFYGASATLTLLYVAVYTGLSVFVVSLAPSAPFSIFAFAVVGGSAFSLLFTRRLLEVDIHFPRLSNVLTAVVWVLLLSALAGLCVDQVKYLGLVSFPMIWFVGLISWKRRVRYSREFVLIYSVFLAGFTIFVLVNFGVLNANFVTRYGFIFGSLFELTGFSALLAYRIRAMQQETDRLAVTDALTGLPNRRLFGDRLHQEVTKSQSAGGYTALMLIDLDRFKEVNDSFGHDVGDELLIEAAKRLRSCIRNYDTVARLGGDEFAVILSEVDDVIVVGSIAQSIIDSLSKEFKITDRSLFVSASIGVTVCPTDGTDPSDLIRYADQAMYRAKTDGRSQFRFFTDTMQQASLERTRLATELRDVLARQQLTVYYQPIVDLASDRITKAEALLRWEHPELGFIPPDSFISIAEEIGMIGEISDWVFDQAVREGQRCRDITGSDFQICVNMSATRFRGIPTGEDPWLTKLRHLELPGHCMVIEITEGVLMKSDTIKMQWFAQYRDAGVQIAVDDFGTGYSALAYLKMFDVDYLKIDKSFTSGLATDSPDLAVSEAIVVMAHKLGLQVIAEGVETAEQLNLLTQMGCDYGQGYLFSRPLPAEAFEALLAHSPASLQVDLPGLERLATNEAASGTH